MPFFSGLSYSLVGDIKNLKPFTSSTVAGFKPNLSLLAALNKQIKDSISIKPLLVPYGQFLGYGIDANLVGVNSTSITSTTDKPVSARLVNWVEPYLISGVRKTLFYTEVNSGLKPGMRVFIINGNYDSDLLIKTDKYKRGRDGYKVLQVDECRVVLDIDFTGVVPWIESSDSDFVNLYYIDSQSDFDTINREITTKNDTVDYKFNLYQNNLIWTTKQFAPTTNGGPSWGVNSGITQSGFWVRDDSNQLGFGTYSWIDVSSAFLSGSYSWALSTTFSTSTRLKIHNGSFNLQNGWSFQEGFVYKWEIGPTQSSWVPDVKYSQSILTKTNFRDGNFEGTWNAGLYGRRDKKISWNGQKAIWNTGTLLNTKWTSGKMNSIYSLSESYITELDEFGNPYQRINGPNNNGRGWNFIIDSEIEVAEIDNGSFYNTEIGNSTVTYSVVEDHLIQSVSQFPITINKAYFEEPNFKNVKVSNSEIRRARSLNSSFDNVKSISSILKQSVVTNSEWISDETIKILNYDEFNISEWNVLSSTYSQRPAASHKLYKFYISKLDYSRIKRGDAIYFKNILINDGMKNLTNFFDKKLILGTIWQYFDDFYDPTNPYLTSTPQILGGGLVPTYSFYKRGVEVTSYLSTPADNKWTISTTKDTFGNHWTEVEKLNLKSGYSIDVFFSFWDRDDNFVDGLDFDVPTVTTTVYGSETMLFTYSVGATPFSEIVSPSGQYDSKPYYILTNGATISYVFFTASNNRWENWQFFNPVNGDTAGSPFYMTLTYSGVNIPDSSTFSWQQASSNAKSIAFSNNYNPQISTSQSVPKVQIDPRPGAKSYILNDDFESGILEKSNWNSGNNINFNADNNITKYSNSGGYFDLQVVTQSQSIIATVGLDNNFRESLDQFFEVGNVMFLNNISYNTEGKINQISILSQGTGYSASTQNLSGGLGTQATVDITANLIGEVIAATISNGGVGYQVGDILDIDNGSSTAQVTVISTTGSINLLPEAYKITNVLNNQITLKEIITTTSSILPLLTGGISYNEGVGNRWGYIYPLKINKSLIKSGLLKRTYLYNNLIKNDELDLTDKDFSDENAFRKLINIENLFYNNSNILSKGSYLHSFFTMGSDLWNDGLLFRSFWKGGTFSRGLIKESRWENGYFESGLFYQSRSFNQLPTPYAQFYDSERIYNNFKSGPTSDILFNNRWSWQFGTFSNGEFLKSDWELGNFLDGKFWNSSWYAGTFSNGIIGDKSISSHNTQFFNGTVLKSIVERADLFARDTSLMGLSQSQIIWKDGVFNDGIFGCDIIIQTSSNHTATWEYGKFNGGEFATNAKWKNGFFNGGKFTSGFGWTYATTAQTQFGWESGQFNGGEFGVASGATNSMWYTGEFNGGKFQGRVWKTGVFTGGDFIGGSSWSAVGGYNPDAMTQSNADQFVDSFTFSFWGLWQDGLVTNRKDEFIKDQKIFSTLKRATETIKSSSRVNFSNMLWQSGTFSHSVGEFKNSVWLSGEFQKGRFLQSSFNPWVKRAPSTLRSFNLNDDLLLQTGQCIWSGGNFENSDFYISQWQSGKFISGTAFGMVWREGISEYMNAYNIFWEDGVWRNGNWFGSYMVYDGVNISDFNKQILLRGMSYSGTSSTHFWNVFQSGIGSTQITTNNASQPVAVSYPPIPPANNFVGPMLSDIRVKKNIKFIKEIGVVNLYQFEYIHLPGRVFEGVIAQELLDTEYEKSVIKSDSGLLMVDYNGLDIKFKEIV